MKEIKTGRMMIGGKARILLYFGYDRDIFRIVRAIPGATFSYRQNAWHIAFTQANLNRLIERFRDIAVVDLAGIRRAGFIASRPVYIDPGLVPLDDRDRKWLKEMKEWMTLRDPV